MQRVKDWNSAIHSVKCQVTNHIPMASSSSPHSIKSRDTRLRLERAWKEDINWDLYPTVLRTVSACFVSNHNYMHCILTGLHPSCQIFQCTTKCNSWWIASGIKLLPITCSSLHTWTHLDRAIIAVAYDFYANWKQKINYIPLSMRYFAQSERKF